MNARNVRQNYNQNKEIAAYSVLTEAYAVLQNNEKFQEDSMKIELFSAECKLCERTFNILNHHFPEVKIEVHKASE